MSGKVLIVDDEPIIRKGISSKIDWDKLQLTKAGEARNGMEAMAVIRQLKPDIVITDIRMPQMDGLQFIDLAKREYPHIQFIIISGYNDFEFARQAIRFGVTDYLLKPVNKEELKQALLIVKERLKPQRDNTDDDKREMRLMLSRLLRNDAEEGTRAAFNALWRRMYASSDPAALSFVVAVYRLQPLKLPYKNFREQESELFDYAIRNLIVHAMDIDVQSVVFQQEAERNEIVAIYGCSRRADWEGESAIRRSAERAVHAIRVCLNLECSAGIGFPSTTDVGNLKRSYEAAVTAVRSEVLVGPGKVHAYRQGALRLDGKAETGGLSFISAAQERLLFASLHEHDGERIRIWLEERYRQLAENPMSGFEQFESLSLHIYTLLGKYLQEHSEATHSLPETTQHFHNVLLSCRSWREMTAALQQFAESIMSATANPHAAKGEQIVESVKRYVDSHYFMNVSLSWVAERFFISPNYFSKLFKEKSGQNFNDYVTHVRLQKSLEMMQDPNLGLTEIAALIGYDSYAYFSSVFRKRFGISPRNYRNTRSGKR